ncbi:MAG TPA: hypothetical protein VNE39_00055 [Planctomycetota bacterium]|nr:hypothetical protein [Planctomycetota bacterium]
MPFFGQYTQRLDGAHRVALPQAFRRAMGAAELKKGLVLTRGFDGCIWAFPQGGWQAAVGEICRSCFAGLDARMLERLFVGGAVQVAVDAQGRFQLPELLGGRAGVNGQVLLIGVGARIELWAPARWQAIEGEAAGRYEELADAAGVR